jgi:hypothetical protein
MRRKENPIAVPAVLDSAGRRRSRATLPGFHSGRAHRKKGMLYTADPPTVEEILCVSATHARTTTARRLREMLVKPWRGGLRVQEALALTEHDLDRQRGSVLVRCGIGGTSARGRDGRMELGEAATLALTAPRAPGGPAVLCNRRPDLLATLVSCRSPHRA